MHANGPIYGLRSGRLIFGGDFSEVQIREHMATI